MNAYKVTVSSLEIRKEPSEASRLTLKRDTVVKLTGSKERQHKKESWIEVETLTDPVVVGYVQKKYLTQI